MQGRAAINAPVTNLRVGRRGGFYIRPLCTRFCRGVGDAAPYTLFIKWYRRVGSCPLQGTVQQLQSFGLFVGGGVLDAPCGLM